jgi:hypothetical protein
MSLSVVKLFLSQLVCVMSDVPGMVKPLFSRGKSHRSSWLKTVTKTAHIAGRQQNPTQTGREKASSYVVAMLILAL